MSPVVFGIFQVYLDRIDPANQSLRGQRSKAKDRGGWRARSGPHLKTTKVCSLVVCSAEARGGGDYSQRRELEGKESKMADSGVIGGYVLLKALGLPDQRSLQNHASLFVSLTVLSGELVDPAQFAVTVLTADISHHVSAGEHDSVLHLAVLQVHHLVEEESSACGSCESCGYQL